MLGLSHLLWHLGAYVEAKETVIKAFLALVWAMYNNTNFFTWLYYKIKANQIPSEMAYINQNCVCKVDNIHWFLVCPMKCMYIEWWLTNMNKYKFSAKKCLHKCCYSWKL